MDGSPDIQNEDAQPLSDETLAALFDLGELLRQNLERLEAQGYRLEHGRILPPPEGV